MLAEYGIGVGVAGGGGSGVPDVATWIDMNPTNLTLIVILGIGSLYFLFGR